MYKNFLIITTGMTAILSGSANAQSSTSTEDTRAENMEASKSGGLAEIVVTAQRRTENLQRTAAAISVRDGAELLNTGKFSLSSIVEDIPGISGGAAAVPGGIPGSSAGTDAPAAGLTIRGIPSNLGAGGSAVSVSTSAAIYVDGVYSGVGSTYDIDRIEVLRGPQGTLYGRSATSGVVAVRTKNPNLTTAGLDASVEVGNFDLMHASGGVSLPIVEDKLAIRVSGNYYGRNGYDTNNDGGAIENTDYRVKLLYKPTSDISLLLGFAGQNNVQNSAGIQFGQISPDTYFSAASPVGEGRNSFRQYWAELNWRLGDVTLTYLPAYRTWKSSAVNFVRIPGLPSGTDQEIDTPKDEFMTHELRLASGDDQDLKWLIGALYYNNKLSNTTVSRDSSSQALQFRSETDKETTAIGAFGELTYSISDRTRLNVGLRYDYTKVQVGQVYTTNLNLGGAFGGGPLGAPDYGLPEVLASQTLSGASGIRKFNNLTYKVRLEYDLTPDNLLYALTSTGFSPGDLGVTTGLNFAPTPLVLETEVLTSYEVGSKNRFLDNKLEINASGFYYVYGGYQVGTINISPIPGTFATTTISAPARAYGGELELLIAPTARDRLGVTMGYTKAYFVKTASQIVPGSGGRTFAYYFADSGIPQVTPFVAQASYAHDFDFVGGSKLTVRANARYLSSSTVGSVTLDQQALGAEPFVQVGSQVVGNLTATWTSSDGHLSVSGYLRNIGDNRYKASARIDNGSPGTFSATRLNYDPRTYGVILSYKF